MSVKMDLMNETTTLLMEEKRKDQRVGELLGRGS
jgi:hypothetical protein